MTATATLARPELNVGDLVEVDYTPGSDWNGLARVDREPRGGYVSVKPLTGRFAGTPGSFSASKLTPTGFVVHEADTLSVLPLGTTIEDMDEDTATLTPDGWVATGWSGIRPDYWFSFPVVITNPQLLDLIDFVSDDIEDEDDEDEEVFGYNDEDIFGYNFHLPAGFKAGDRVRITNANYRRFEGFEGILESDGMVTPLSDRPDGFGRSRFLWPGHELVKVDMSKELSVGDVVRIEYTPKDLGEDFAKDWLGFEAKVKEITTSGRAYLEPLSDRRDGHGRFSFYWDAEGLVVVKPAPKQEVAGAKAEIKVGDKVRIARADFATNFIGFEAEVVRLHLDDYQSAFLKPLSRRPDGGHSNFYWDLKDLELVEAPVADDTRPVIHDQAGLDALPYGSVVLGAPTGVGRVFRKGIYGYWEQAGSCEDASDTLDTLVDDGVIVLHIPDVQ